MEPPPAVWESGPTRLLDYGTTDPAGTDGDPVLFVPSLVNRSYIMDLTAERSLMRFLAARGFRPLLLDWGTPGPRELAMGFDDCIGATMREALAVANERAGGPVPVVGYCMGGTMATALACLCPDRIAALALLAAPWDFHAATGGPPPMIVAGRTALEGILATMECLPVDAIQALFFSLDPVKGWSKFRAFARLRPDSPQAATFVALEDWLNDGV
ncbi:MAG: alpha/beta fold hydrolase, partial [Rhodospirillaceae bacterium]